MAYMRTCVQNLGEIRRPVRNNCPSSLIIDTLKEVIDFYHSQSTSIYMCFMDASKAFDRVNHWTLFKKLIDRGTPLIFVRIIMQWYTTQKACVRWGSALSDNFLITNGVRQGGILSPLFFCVYMDCLSESLCNTQTGCNVGGVMINHLMYADDLVIISPSAKGLQRLVDYYVLCMVRFMTYYLTRTKQSTCICLRVTIIILIRQLLYLTEFSWHLYAPINIWALWWPATMPTTLTCVGKEAYAMLVPMALLRIFQCARLWWKPPCLEHFAAICIAANYGVISSHAPLEN